MSKYLVSTRSLLLLLIPLLIWQGCSRNQCIGEFGFEISGDLLFQAGRIGVTYCELVGNALNADETSLIELSILEFDAGFSYEHGAVLIEVIDSLGESKYIEVVEGLPEIERQKIASNLEGGFEWTRNPKFEGNTIKESFPSLYVILGD